MSRAFTVLSLLAVDRVPRLVAFGSGRNGSAGTVITHRLNAL